jgi:hypothetical protein
MPRRPPASQLGATLKVQAERERACCGETFGSVRPSHRLCSDTCKAEAALLVAVLEGRSRKYASLPARLAAATGAPSTAATGSRTIACSTINANRRRVADAG